MKMNREARRLIVSAVTVVTFVALFFLVNPIVQRLATAKIDAIAKAGGSGVASAIMWQGVVPQVATVFACLLVALGVGLVVGAKLPHAESPPKRNRRR